MLTIRVTETNEEFREINANISRTSFFYSIFPTLISYIVGSFFVVLPIIINIYRTVKGLDLIYELPFKVM